MIHALMGRFKLRVIYFYYYFIIYYYYDGEKIGNKTK
jgi:hypothetical protein